MNGGNLNAEYMRIRRNTLQLLNRARKDNIYMFDLKVPDIPKRITAGSVRRIEKAHKVIKDEIARRRRIAHKLPEPLPPIALENLKDMFTDGAEFTVEAAKDAGLDYTSENALHNYVACVVASGNAGLVLLDRVRENIARQMMEKYPDKSPIYRKIMTDNTLITNAENLLREEEDRVKYFVWGYKMPNQDEKVGIYAMMRSMLGMPLTPSEESELFSGKFEVWGFDEYE